MDSDSVELSRLRHLATISNGCDFRKCLSLVMDVPKDLFKNSNVTYLLYAEKSTVPSATCSRGQFNMIPGRGLFTPCILPKA